MPTITLALFLFLALGVFENDKVAYIYESSASVSKTLSSQVSTELNSTLTAAKPMMQEFLLNNQFATTSKSLFESDGAIQWIAAYKYNSGKAEKLDFLVRAAAEGQGPEVLGDVTQLLAEAQSQQRIVRVPFKDDRMLFVEKVSTPEGDRYFIFLAKLAGVAENFRSPSSSEVFLLNRNGFILLGAQGTEATYLSQKLDVDVTERLKDQKFASGTEELKSAKGEPWLASIAKVNFSDLFVVSLVPKKEALRAAQVLLRKSIVFFLFLLSVTTIVSLVSSGTLTRPLTELFEATKKVADGNFAIRVVAKSRDEIGSLATSFNAMAIEVSRLMAETAEKARMEGELKTAQTVQETLFPQAVSVLDGFRIAGHYEPASECGGDWWHYCQVGRKIFLWIGDATGHGAPAALITSAAKSAATIIETLKVTPDQAMALLNRAIFDVSKGRIMMTFFLGCYDLDTRDFSYANASHESPFLIKYQAGTIKKRDLIPLNEVNSPRLGQDRDTVYQQTTVRLEPGDRIFFYTDGLPDIQNQEKVGWGEREFVKGIIASNQGFPDVDKSVAQLILNFSEYRQGAPLIDDITFFMTQLEGPQA